MEGKTNLTRCPTEQHSVITSSFEREGQRFLKLFSQWLGRYGTGYVSKFKFYRDSIISMPFPLKFRDLKKMHDGPTDGRTDGQTGGQTERLTDGQNLN